MDSIRAVPSTPREARLLPSGKSPRAPCLGPRPATSRRLRDYSGALSISAVMVHACCRRKVEMSLGLQSRDGTPTPA